MRIIAGPCQHETYEQSLEIATECKRVCDMYGVEYIFKASYDKANRTHINGERGRGMVSTLEELKQIKELIEGLKILTDVHSEKDVYSIADFYRSTVDVVQIPAFLCRQTDIIQAACELGFIVNIKKGQFLAPWDVEGILSKTEGAKEVWITERGTSFGYNNLVVDFTGIDYMLNNYNVPIIFDVTHSVQKPGGLGKSSGGNRSYVPGLCRAASALGVSNFFIEVHADPDNAPSDGPNMVRLEDFEKLIKDIYDYRYIDTSKN
jgi:2-dehydro-3-deoxyphosphooctonate aldolase (KDO 8-P synthase)